jgi:uncharacterized membrane protein
MKTTFLFGKKNFILLIVGLVLIAFGFILMSGGGSDDPNVFNPEIFNSTRIIIAPIFILAGFIVEIFAIMSKPEESAE